MSNIPVWAIIAGSVVIVALVVGAVVFYERTSRAPTQEGSFATGTSSAAGGQLQATTTTTQRATLISQMSRLVGDQSSSTGRSFTAPSQIAPPPVVSAAEQQKLFEAMQKTIK